MYYLLDTLEDIRTALPKRIRYGLVALLAVLAFIFLFVGGGLSNNALLALIIIFILAILFLALEPRRFLCAAAVFAFFCIAIYLRVVPSHDLVFVGDWVKFGGNDPWYHMRLVENLVQHFPHRIEFDPYTLYPSGQEVMWAPFFDLLLGFIIWIVGAGHPSPGTIETVGAYFPAVLGALTVIPVYFIGKVLFSRTAGLLAAALIAILPGEFFFRSMLGFTDHHILETLLSTVVILFMILTVKSAREKGIAFSSLKGKDWASLRKPLLFTVLAGITMALYLLSWAGGLLFVFIIFVYVLVQYVIDHASGRSTDYLCITMFPLFLISLILVSPGLELLRFGELVVWSLVIAMLAPLALSGLSRTMEHFHLSRVYYPLALIGIALVGLGLFYAINSDLLTFMVKRFNLFIPSAESLTIMEARPFFSDFYSFADHRVWRYFTTGTFIVPVALLMLIYNVFRERSAQRTLLIIWSLIMLVALIGQTRFAYYYAVNVAILVGYFCWRIPAWLSRGIEWAFFREPTPVEKRKKKKATKRGEAPEERQALAGFASAYLKPAYISAVLGLIIIFFLAFYPAVGQVKTLASSPWGPSESWHSALAWMQENTPDPFDDPDFYYERYDKPDKGEAYDYPESSYGIMSWWDYGHWITRIAHRIPNANPHQKGIKGELGVATFLIAPNEAAADAVMDGLNSKYVVIDTEMATTKFHTPVTWAGNDRNDYYAPFYQSTPQGSDRYVFYLPAYYQSMCIRLYNFGGEAVVADNSTWAIAYTQAADGTRFITGVANGGLPFATYGAAQAFIDANPEYIIVGLHPFMSPVDLEAVEHYELVHQPEAVYITWLDMAFPYVRIFEYTP